MKKFLLIALILGTFALLTASQIWVVGEVFTQTW